MAETHTRLAKRAPVTLKIKFKSSTLDQFIERYSVDVSHGGIFIRTKDPLAVGTNMRFEFQLKDATPLIRGEGTVVWTRERDPSRTGVAPGMGVRFDRLGDGSQEVLDKILAQKSTKGGAQKGPSFNEQPTKVAPSPLLAGLNKASSQPVMGNMAPKPDSFGSAGVDHTGTDATPLPTPMPFHSDADDFPEEAFEEATKVASLDALAAQSLREDLDEEEHVKPVIDELAERRSREDEEAAAAKEAEQKAAATKKQADAEAADALEKKQKVAAQERETGKKKATASEATTDKAKHGAAAAKSQERKKAAAAQPAPQQASGSGMKYAMIAVLILAAGGGTYWYMNKDKGTDKVASTQGPGTTTTPAEPAAAPPTPALTAPTAAVKDPVPVAPVAVVETFQATIKTEPKDAVIEVLGATADPKSPGAFKLEKGVDHTARVSAPGFLSREVSIAEADAETKIKLEPKPRILRITSEPAGAKVTVKGRPMKGVTPMDVGVSKRLARPRIAIVLSMKGYKSKKLFTSGTEGFVEGDDTMVSELSAPLVKKVFIARKPKVDKPKVDKPKDDKPKDDKPKVDEPKDDKPKVDEPKDDKPKDDKPKDDKPKVDEPLDKEPDEGSTGPKPDWLN